MTTQTKGHRFGMRITPLSQALLIPFGVSSRRAYAQIRDGELHMRFGPMFDERIMLENIERAEVARWPRWAGVGPRANFRGTLGLVSSYGNVVKLTFKEPIDVHLYMVPVNARRLYLSLENPDEFLKTIGKAPAEEHVPAKAA
jgi:hypothetical protein